MDFKEKSSSDQVFPMLTGSADGVPASVDAASIDSRNVRFSVIFSALFIFVLWLSHILVLMTEFDARHLAIHPRHIDGIPGIIAEPLLHADFSHLFSNTVPLFFMLAALLYFYRPLALRIFGLIWLLTGLWVWCFARESYHIGASGIVYGLATFLAFSGFIRGDHRLMSVSLLTIFLYGSMVWGIFPIFFHISWESHLMGAIAGGLLAWYYRKEGPQKPVYFEDEDVEELIEVANEPENNSATTITNPGTFVVYRYIPSPEKSDSNDLGSKQ
jgi:membrane associated rhomboid family serine protease